MVAEEGAGRTHGSQFFWKTEGGEGGRSRGGIASSKGKQTFLLATSSLKERGGSFVYVQPNLNDYGQNPALLRLPAYQQITTPQCSLAT